MKNIILCCLLALAIIGCTNNTAKKEEQKPERVAVNTTQKKEIDKNLPTIGVLVFEGVIINEVVAPFDVFSSTDSDGKHLFNVITIATENKIYNSAHGLKIIPDYLVDEIPSLKVLVVPSSYNPENQTSDKKIVSFIQEQNTTTDYIASHCAGAFLIGESGIAKGKEIVTYCGGGQSLQNNYPTLKVANDNEVKVVQDGKFISSNGNLVSYIASLDLLETLTTKKHRKYVEKAILLNRLKEK